MSHDPTWTQWLGKGKGKGIWWSIGLILGYQNGRELEILMAKRLGRFDKISEMKKPRSQNFAHQYKTCLLSMRPNHHYRADERRELSNLLLEFLEQASHALLHLSGSSLQLPLGRLRCLGFVMRGFMFCWSVNLLMDRVIGHQWLRIA